MFEAMEAQKSKTRNERQRGSGGHNGRKSYECSTIGERIVGIWGREERLDGKEDGADLQGR